MIASLDRRVLAGMSILALGAGFGVVGLEALLPLADLLGLAMLLLGFTVVWMIGLKHPEVRALLIFAFSIRAIFALVNHYGVPLPDSQADAVNFERVAAQWAGQGVRGVLTHFTTGSYFYSWIISLLYSITMRSSLMMQGINVLFGTLIVWNVYRLSHLIWGGRSATRAGYIAAVFPTLVLYSAITLREVAVVFPFTLGVLYFVRWFRSDRLGDFGKAFAAFALSMAFHTGMIVAVLILAIAALRRWLDAFLVSSSRKLGKRGLAVVVVAIGVCIIVVSGWGLGKLGGLQHTDPMSWLTAHQEVAARDRAAYLRDLQPRTPLDLVWQTPVRVVYFLFAPFPWMVRSPADLLGLVIVVLNAGLVLLLLRSMLGIWADRRARWSFYILLGVLMAFALTTSNYGTSLRHSAKLVPLALGLARVPRVSWGGRRGNG